MVPLHVEAGVPRRGAPHQFRKSTNGNRAVTLCSVVDHLFSRIVDHYGRFEILKLRLRPKERLDSFVKSRAVCFFAASMFFHK